MIRFENVSRRFGTVPAVDDVDLEIPAGQFCVVIGPSGSGKSTLLRMVNRLVEHDAGRILIAGREIRDFSLQVLRRRMGYAIQSIGLFPHWTVERNIAAVPKLLGWDRARIAARVRELADLLRLDPATLGRHPHELSGGQQQRVGVARALAGDPDVLLMDEPFGALDPVTRAALQEELARIHAASGKTILFVTHDMDEALRLAERIVILRAGRIVQEGRPIDILAHPADDFVLDFLGRAEIGLKRLGLETVAGRMRREVVADPAAPTVAAETNLREALSGMIVAGTDRLAVVDAEGRPAGILRLADIVAPPP